jgi:membrane protein
VKPRERIRDAVQLLSASIQGWQRADAPLHAAGLAYYTLFSAVPLTYLVLNLVARFFTEDATEQLTTVLTRAVGPTATGLLLNLLAPEGVRQGFGWSALLAIGLLTFGASTVFLRLRLSLNAMWGLVPTYGLLSARSGAVASVWERLVAAGAALALGVVVLAVIVLNTFTGLYLRPWISKLVPAVDSATLTGGGLVVPFLFILMMAGIFKWLPQAEVRWRHVWPGATVAGLLFWITAHAMSLYVSFAIRPSVQAAAASVMAFLLWGYVAALSLLFGARLVAEVARADGEPVRPGRGWELRPTASDAGTLPGLERSPPQ